MKIAIDLVCTSNNSGSKTYNSKFLKYLSKQKIDNEIIIFICEGLHNSLKEDLEINKKIKFEIKSDKLSNGLNRLLWMQLILPFKLKTQGVSILYSPLNIIPLLNKIFKIKSTLCLHSNLPWVFFNKMPGNVVRNFLTKFLMECSIYLCDKLIVNSNFAKKEIEQKLKLKNKKIKKIYLGIEKSYLVKSNKYYLNKFNYKQRYILSVISCVKYHNIKNLILAYRNLKSKNEISHKFVIVMQVLDKEYFSLIQELIKNNNLSNEVIIFKNLDHNFLQNLYKNSKLYIFSSYSEVFGLTTLEAMSNKCNVLISNHSSLPEINSDAADYFDPDNIKNIEKKIKFNLFNKQQRKKLIRNSIKRVKIFKWRKTVSQTLEFIQK